MLADAVTVTKAAETETIIAGSFGVSDEDAAAGTGGTWRAYNRSLVG